MKFAALVKQTYEETHDHLEQVALDDMLFGPPGMSHRPYDRVNANNAAYAILYFAQFEALVNELVERAIQGGKTSGDAAIRRVWGVMDDRNRQTVTNMPFLDRVALLLDKGDALYGKVKELYQRRNAIAHGSRLLEEIDVTELAVTLDGIAARLQGAP
ncbi:hypothetical protein HHL28_17540 [Aerophototrophica crusticola]|uniref:RiboL-PSP-HEPN domain-containing protein n=1 Tax=Aerophototrophica crusticola TaxID=1709002 RepID=A0A858RC25_9PROT|nr:hypothetical protein HHL28_17540 [Rhodospirillaceae bacterium B3]